jgi:predicted nucleotidyltransferase
LSGEHLSSLQAEALASMTTALAPDHWVLIGAAAIGFHVKLPRTTADVDFVVAASGESVASRLSDAGWSRHPRKRQRWLNGDAFVDVVPANAEAILLGEVRLDEDFVLSVVGFDLALSDTELRAVRPGLDILVPRLPILVLLKMISWLDRPYERTKDLGDLLTMLEDGLPPDAECRWEPGHPVCAEDLQYSDQSPFWLGLELGKVSEAAHLHWAKRFLDTLRDEGSPAFSQFCAAASIPRDGAEDRCRARLDALERGLEAGARCAPSSSPLPDDQVAPVDLFSWRRSGSREMVLHDAIDRRRVVRFRYAGYEREAEPHVLGLKGGRLQLLTWQTGGRSSSGGLPDWRLFFVDQMTGLEIGQRTFEARRSRTGRHRDFDRQIAIVR